MILGAPLSEDEPAPGESELEAMGADGSRWDSSMALDLGGDCSSRDLHLERHLENLSQPTLNLAAPGEEARGMLLRRALERHVRAGQGAAFLSSLEA